MSNIEIVKKSVRFWISLTQKLQHQDLTEFVKDRPE